MAEQLIASLKSSAVPTSTKLDLAKHAFETPAFIFPLKYQYLADWTITVMFKSRTWASQQFGVTPIASVEYWDFLATLLAHPHCILKKSSLFGLMMVSVHHLSSVVVDTRLLDLLLDPISQCMRVFIGTYQHLYIKSQFDPWIQMLRALLDLKADSRDLVSNAVQGYSLVYTRHPTPAVAYSNLCANLEVWIRLLQFDHPVPSIVNLFEASLANRDISLEFLTLIVRSCVGSVPSTTTSDPRPQSKKRKVSNVSTSATTKNVFPADLSKALNSIPADIANHAFTSLLKIFTQIVSTFNLRSLLMSLPGDLQPHVSVSNPNLIILSPSLINFTLFQSLLTFLPTESKYELITEMWSILVPQLHLSDDHNNQISDSLNKSLLESCDSDLLRVQRFLVLSKISMKPLMANIPCVVQAFVNFVLSGDESECIQLMAELLDRFGNARILDVFFFELGRSVSRSHANQVLKVLGNRSTLELFMSQLVKCPYSSWFSIANDFMKSLILTDNSVPATYLSVMLQRIPTEKAFRTQRLEFCNQVKSFLQSSISSNRLLVHQTALVCVTEYQALWSPAESLPETEPELVSIIRHASTQFPWMALPVILSGFSYLPPTYKSELVDLAHSVVNLFTLEDVVADATAEWSLLFWDLGYENQRVYWWITIVQDLDFLPMVVNLDTLNAIGRIFTATLSDSITLVKSTSISVMSVSTRTLLTCGVYEIEWLRPIIKQMFLADPTAVFRKSKLLAYFPAAYFSPSERSSLARRIMAVTVPESPTSNCAEARQSWYSVMGHLALCLDLPVIPNSLQHALECVESCSPVNKIRLSYLFIQRLLQTAHTEEARLDILEQLMLVPRVGNDSYLALRVVMYWCGMERNTHSRAQLIAQVAEKIWTSGKSVDPVHVAFMYQITAKQVDAGVPKTLRLDVDFIQTYIVPILEQASVLDPIVITAIHSYLNRIDKADEFKALYTFVLEHTPIQLKTPSSEPNNAVATWIALVHVFTSVSKHHPMIRQLMRHTLLQIDVVLESVTSLGELLSIFNLLDCLTCRVVRMSTQKLSHMMMVLTKILGQTFASRFYSDVAPHKLSQAERDSLFLAVAQILDSVLQHQRHSLIKIPVLFTTMLQHMLFSFLEPGRYAFKQGDVQHDRSMDTAVDKRKCEGLPLMLLTSLAPVSEPSAWAWNRLVQNIGNLPVPVLLSLKGTPTTKVITPITIHLVPVVVEYVQWRASTIPSVHPRFGWTLSTNEKVRGVLARGIFEVLDLIGDSRRAQVLSEVPNPAKEPFKELVADYIASYQYKGKV